MAALVRNPFLYLLIGSYVLSARRMASAQHRYAGDAIFTLLLFGVVAGVIALLTRRLPAPKLESPSRGARRTP